MDPDQHPSPRQSAHPPAVRPRSIGLGMLLWTALAVGSFAYLAVRDPSTPAVIAAVGGLVAMVWIIGMIMLAMFLGSAPD